VRVVAGRCSSPPITDPSCISRRPPDWRLTLVTINPAFSEWVSVFSDEKLTMALLDRPARHSHILTTESKSYWTFNQKGGLTD
jgi:DNA replication protein DnaC